MATDLKPSLTLKRRYSAAPEQVFSAWTDPQKLGRWFHPGASEPLLAESDARVGGRYRIVMRADDGEQHDVSGTFREVVPNRRLAFTWAWRSTPERESLVTVELRPDGNGTLLTLTHEGLLDEPTGERHHSGWKAVLDRLHDTLPVLD